MKEIWKPVKNHPHYKISNLGRVISFKKNKKSYVLKTRISNCNYIQVCFKENSQNYFYYVHRLVAEAFILNPENKPEVNHKDGNRQNNNVNNLEWCTKSENKKHAIRTGLTSIEKFKKTAAKGERNGFSKLTEKEVLEIREKHKSKKYTYKEIAEQYNIYKSTVNKIVSRITWRHI